MELELFWFAPDKLNLYGDRGNIIVLKDRCEKRDIKLNITEIKSTTDLKLAKSDILFIGGGSDREQSLVTEDLMKIKDEFKSAIEDGVSALTICGGYQFLGNYYELIDGTKLNGLGILDFYNQSKAGRLIGNVLIENEKMGKIVGFENHGGRTYHNYDSLGKVIKGNGNNGEDGKEGLIYKNMIGTYLHGPILPKNPNIADYIILNSLERKYGTKELSQLSDKLENEAKENMIKKMGV